MIQVQTKIKIADNSGAKTGQCIKVYKGNHATIGDIILLSIKKVKKKLNNRNKLTKGSIYKSLIIRTKFKTINHINNYIQFSENSGILLNSKNKPLGTRIFGPIPISLRKIKQFKIISLSSTLL